jgi:anaerobic ribonucleoside-triphosphate reductase
MAEIQELPLDRAEIAARRDKDGLLDVLDAKLEHYLHTLHEYQEVMQQLSKELSSVGHLWV